MNRRTFLARFGAAAGIGSLAGCNRNQQPETPNTPPPTATETQTSTPGTETETETVEPSATETATESPDLRDRPVIFISPAEVRAARAKVEAGKEPWKTSYEKLMDDADSALDATPKSVVDNGAPVKTDDAHKYGSDAPYQGKDGVYSDDINRHDYLIALDMKDWIRDTAQAYAFSREDKYAEKAIDLLHHWFLKEDTRMYPSVINYGPHTEDLKGQNSIEHYIFLPAMFYGAALVSGHPYWEEKEGASEEALLGWVRTFQKSLETGPHGGTTGDEIYKWWTTTRAITAALLGDEEGLQAAFDEWRSTALKDYNERGTFEAERVRTRGLFYSLSAENALTLGAEVARHHGVDLYQYVGDKEGPDKSVLRRAYDFHAEYIIDPSEWPWKERKGLERSEREYGLVGYELAYSYWQDDQYLEAIQKFGRPIHDWRVLGWVTLTHGNRFALDVPSE